LGHPANLHIFPPRIGDVQRLYTTHPALLLFLLTATAYTLLVLFFSRPPGMSMTNGDEPHYLLQAHSLVNDGDLEMQNNYTAGDYRDFFDTETLNVGAYLYEYNGRTIRHHFALGMPLLLAPAYALGGRVGVQLLLALLTAGGMSALLLAVRRFVAPRAAFAGVLLCALLYPIVIYSHQIYPETVILALTAFVLALTLVGDATHVRRRALLVGLAVGLMPHFQNKFILLSALLYAFLLWELRAHLGVALRWSLPPIVLLAAGHLAWAYVIYGEIGRSALISPGYPQLVDARIDDGVLGLWFDQEVGLFFFAPLYLLALPGGWVLLREPVSRGAALWLALIYASFHLLGGAYYDWPAGLSPAPRYLVPVLPVLVIFTAAGLAWLLRRGQLLQPLLLVVVTAYFTYLILFVQRAFMFPFYIGTNTILRDHFRGNPIVERLIMLLPSFLRAIDSAYPKTLLVTVVVLAGMLAAIPLNRLLTRALRRFSA
jgi:hypothetical protein